MRCRDYREQFSAYLDEELTSSQRAKLEAHARSCASCTRELALLRAMTQSLKSLGQVKAPDNFVAGVRQKLHPQLADRRWLQWQPTWIPRPALALGLTAVLVACVVTLPRVFQRRTQSQLMLASAPRLREKEGLEAVKESNSESAYEPYYASSEYGIANKPAATLNLNAERKLTEGNVRGDGVFGAIVREEELADQRTNNIRLSTSASTSLATRSIARNFQAGIGAGKAVYELQGVGGLAMKEKVSDADALIRLQWVTADPRTQLHEWAIRIPSLMVTLEPHRAIIQLPQSSYAAFLARLQTVGTVQPLAGANEATKDRNKKSDSQSADPLLTIELLFASPVP